MRVELSSLAKKQVRKTVKYIDAKFGGKSRDKFMDEFSHTMYLLGINPYIGPIEPSLANRPIEYHSIVIARINKAIYTVSDSIVKVIAFWDCRRNPKTLVAQVKDGK